MVTNVKAGEDMPSTSHYSLYGGQHLLVLTELKGNGGSSLSFAYI